MGISVHLHRVFQKYCGNLETIEAKGSTVQECLRNILILYPELEKAIFFAEGKLHPLIEVYVNSSSAYPDALKKEVNDGDKIHIIHTLAGG
ncbi:MAG: MoaD/ThiS family protein [Deltaproteobacteria bacterium]|nr:MoaD/ThiS family protein [Deltaproteobacteria bacterium]